MDPDGVAGYPIDMRVKASAPTWPPSYLPPLGQGLHVGAENQVRVALPGFELMFLRGTDGAADHLKNVGGPTTMAVVQTHRNAHYDLSAKFAGCTCGHGRH